MWESSLGQLNCSLVLAHELIPKKLVIKTRGTKTKRKSVICVSGVLAPVVQKVDSAIHWINLYPVDNAISFPNTNSLDSDLSGG